MIQLPSLSLLISFFAALLVAEAQMSMRVFSSYFGALPYGRVAITQQPKFNSGQSWPTLVYLPVRAATYCTCCAG